MKRIYTLLIAILAVLCLFGCSAQQENSVQIYTVEECVHSATVNQWKTLYLLDEDTYTLTVYALDGATVTTDFYMTGKYTKNPDGTITIQPGHGYMDMLHGDIPVKRQVQPDANGQMSLVYWELMGDCDTFILNKDGTWTGA